MNVLAADMALAAWLGILTSISPCPLATNIAAISFIAKQVDRKKKALLAGLWYALGRTVVYVALGAALVSGSLAVPAVSMFLQRNMNAVLAPVLILAGFFMLDFFRFSFGRGLLTEGLQKRLAGAGHAGAFLLGFLFALSFCPVSAGLFFGSTAGLAVKHGSRFAMPALFGVGTAAPVALFAFVIAFSAHAVGTVYQKIAVFEKWARKISGAVFITAGFYILFFHVFNLF